VSYTHDLTPSKLALIDKALESYDLRSIVDLGACWGVHGGYTFHALNSGKISKAYVVDGHLTPETVEHAKKYSQLTLISGQLGDKNIADRIGSVDAIIMYDILLHQVAPDWDEFLEIWGKTSRHLIIYNQNWTKDNRVIRFVDEDVEWYLKNVPHNDDESVRSWYPKHCQFNQELGRKWRDVHYFWQFGIPFDALCKKLNDIGFAVDFSDHDTPFNDKYPWVMCDAILATKKPLPRR
jgi:hypothetical protein